MAKKFKFRLEAVEKIRRVKEQEALRGLAHAQSKFQVALNHKVELLGELEKSLIRREGLGTIKAAPALDFQMETAFISGTKQRIIQADQAILRAKKFVEKALRELLVARRALRTIETLREKAYEEFKREMRKREQKALEDIYVGRSNRALISDIQEIAS